MPEKEARKHKKRSARMRLTDESRLGYRALFMGVFAGLVTGVLVSLLRLILTKADDMRELFLDSARQKFALVLLGLVMLVFIAVCVIAVTRREPAGRSSGISEVKDELSGRSDANWMQVLIARFIGIILTVGSGLAVGREEAGVQLGAMTGKGLAHCGRRRKGDSGQNEGRLAHKKELLMTYGSGAGFAAAFGAPLAGVAFVLEKLRADFSRELLLGTMAAAITADFIGVYAFDLGPVFDFGAGADEMLPLTRMWMVALLGLILGVLGTFFNKTLSILSNVLRGLKPGAARMMIPFVLLLVLCIWLPEALGSGSELIEAAGRDLLPVKAMFTFLAVKYVFSALCCASGVPGGFMLPLMVISALAGGIFAEIVGAAAGFEEHYLSCFLILGMAGALSASLKAPVTAVLLLCEITGSLNYLLPLSAVVVISYITADALKAKPLFSLRI